MLVTTTTPLIFFALSDWSIMYTPQICENEECDNELDIFLANRYDESCTPLCAMKAYRQKNPHNQQQEEE